MLRKKIYESVKEMPVIPILKRVSKVYLGWPSVLEDRYGAHNIPFNGEIRDLRYVSHSLREDANVFYLTMDKLLENPASSLLTVEDFKYADLETYKMFIDVLAKGTINIADLSTLVGGIKENV